MPRIVPTWAYVLLFIALGIGNIYLYRELFAPPSLTATVLEAGESAVVLLKTPRRDYILVNTGADAGVLRELGGALPFFTRRLSVIILTHIADETTGGLADISRRYQVGALIRPSTEGSRYQESVVAAAAAKIPVIRTKSGAHYTLGGASFDILSDDPLTLRVSDGVVAYQINDQGAVVK